MLTLFAFIVALGLLIAVHEYGHYRVAVACGVKVLRFSIGMGKPLLKWSGGRNGETEFVIAALPLGGYVRMLDEREGAVAASELHRSFNHQPLRHKVAVVAAGPAANLILAVVLYSIVNWVGLEQPRAILSVPEAGTLAADAGMQGGEEIIRLQRGDEAPVAIESFEDLRWQLTQAAIAAQDASLYWKRLSDGAEGKSILRVSSLQVQDLDPVAFSRIGIVTPWAAPLVDEVMEAMPAQKAGLLKGDLVLSVNGERMGDASQLRKRIRQAGADASLMRQIWQVERQQQVFNLTIYPELIDTADGKVGRIGAFIGSIPPTVIVQKGMLQGFVSGVAKTWEVTVLSVQMMAKMLIGQASLQNLSGPLTIADYAGKSASLGLVQYILFLALISVSLGVLNLLPLPVLDGGHLMYYLWEGVTGHPVSDAWMERLQRVGIGLLLVMMSIALFNDIGRIWG